MAKTRKWSNLKGTLPEAPPKESTEWMQKVFAAKDERAGKTMNELALEYADLEEEEAFAELAASERNIKYAAIERRVLEELAKVEELAGTDMWRGEGQTFSPKNTLRPVIKDPGALMQWIKDTGQEDQLTLPDSRLKNIVAEALSTDAAAMLTPAQRAQLKPGDPASGACPPGVEAYLQIGVHHTSNKPRLPKPSDD